MKLRTMSFDVGEGGADSASVGRLKRQIRTRYGGRS